jgi:TPR repeat protein
MRNWIVSLLFSGIFWQYPVVFADDAVIHRDDWYLSQAEESATIQISGHATEEGAIAYIKGAGLSGEFGYYQTQYKNRPWYAVTFGIFNTLDEARSQIKSLPEKLQHHSPWPRSFKAIKLLIDVPATAAENVDTADTKSQSQKTPSRSDTLTTSNWEQRQAAYDEGDFATAFKIWQGLAEQGDELSQFNLGVMYSRGEGVEKNGSRALEWYSRSARQGYAPAQFNLGTVYLEGKFTSKDATKAAAWWQMAAEQGFVQAQFNVASLYCRGIGVTRDRDQCKFWYQRADSNGDTHARRMLDLIIARENELKTKAAQEKTAASDAVTMVSDANQSAGKQAKPASVNVAADKDQVIVAVAEKSESAPKKGCC